MLVIAVDNVCRSVCTMPILIHVRNDVTVASFGPGKGQIPYEDQGSRCRAMVPLAVTVCVQYGRQKSRGCE